MFLDLRHNTVTGENRPTRLENFAPDPRHKIKQRTRQQNGRATSSTRFRTSFSSVFTIRSLRVAKSGSETMRPRFETMRPLSAGLANQFSVAQSVEKKSRIHDALSQNSTTQGTTKPICSSPDFEMLDHQTSHQPIARHLFHKILLDEPQKSLSGRVSREMSKRKILKNHETLPQNSIEISASDTAPRRYHTHTHTHPHTHPPTHPHTML